MSTALPRFLLLILGGCLLSFQALAATDSILAQSTFDDGLDGWTSNTPNEIAWSAGGGNPGGRVVFTDQSNNSTYLIAPNTFLAASIDYSKLNGKAYFSWQHEIVQITGSSVIPYEIRLAGPGGTAKFDGGLPLLALNKWQTVVAPLVQGDWTVTSGSWKALLADVESIQINIETINNSPDVEAMDNIKLVSHPKGFSPL